MHHDASVGAVHHNTGRTGVWPVGGLKRFSLFCFLICYYYFLLSNVYSRDFLELIKVD